MTIKLYWWRGEGATHVGKQNFGDYLSPLIVEMLAGRKVAHAEPREADMIAIGSILSRERKARSWLFKRPLHIWGSGTDRDSRLFGRHHHYHAVRGAITRSQIDGPEPSAALGDPGLLVDRLYDGCPVPSRRYRLGIVPHFVDQQDARLAPLLALPSTRLIDVFSPVAQVVREIRQCEFILSSSMHGLIIADAYGIPNRRIFFSRGIISDLKFDDYYSAFGINSPAPVSPESVAALGFNHPVFTEDYARPGLEEVKAGLARAFPDL